MRERIEWIDMVRGLAMMAILLLHTETYYTGSPIIPYNMYVEDALALFFFVSGWLFANPERPFSAWHKLRSVLRGLLLPYLLFTLLIAVPKAIVHGNKLSAWSLVRPILTGDASWFVAALIVAEVYMTASMTISQRIANHNVSKRLLATTLLLLLPFALYISADNIYPLPILNAVSIALVFLCAGHWGRMGQWWSKKCVGSWHKRMIVCRHWGWLLSAMMLVVLKWYEASQNINLVFYYIYIDSYTIFVTDCLLACVTIVGFCHNLEGRGPKVIYWTGRHSLVIYFLCGAIPMLVSRFMPTYNGCYMLVVAAFAIVWTLACASGWLISRAKAFCNYSAFWRYPKKNW